jgi:hypothetical protein
LKDLADASHCRIPIADCWLVYCAYNKALALWHLTDLHFSLKSPRHSFTAPDSPIMTINKQPSRPKILIPEKVSPDGLALLKDLFEVDEKKGLSPEELQNIIGDYEALIVRSETQVTAELLKAAKKLKVVARAGVGVDNVDVQSATQHGIIVVNSPSGNINAAAEHTIACRYPEQ